MWNTIETKLPTGSISGDEFNYRRAQVHQKFYTLATSWSEKKYDEAFKELKDIVITSGYFKENGKAALLYLDEM